MIDLLFSSKGYRDYSILLDLVITIADKCKGNCSAGRLSDMFKEFQQKRNLSKKDVTQAYFFYIDNVLTFKKPVDLNSLESEFYEYSQETSKLMRKLVSYGIITLQQLEDLIDKVSVFSLERISADDLKKIVSAIVFSETDSDNLHNSNIEVN